VLRKIFKTGHSLVVALPKDMLELLGISEGAKVSVNLDRENRRIIISPARQSLVILGVDEAFAQQVAEFVEQYRPALEALSKL
jgi:antitoxin component of MazEF toxin-antitoxin module